MNKDPTQTTTLRRRYAQRLRGEFADVNTEIRAGVRDRDAFNLTSDALAEDVPQFRFETDARKVQQFDEWLRRQFRRGVLEVVTRGENRYIRSAYSRGVTHADAALNRQGVTVPEETIELVFDSGVHRDSLELLFTRNYSDLRGITDETAKQVSRELTQGFAQGWNPRKTARKLTDRVDKIGKTRATTLARTETINAHSTATLNRYEELGVDSVTVEAEWSTAGDSKVCPICEALEGRVMSIGEARTETFRYQADEGEAPSLSGEYPLKPPAHPNCRCAMLPVI